MISDYFQVTSKLSHSFPATSTSSSPRRISIRHPGPASSVVVRRSAVDRSVDRPVHWVTSSWNDDRWPAHNSRSDQWQIAVAAVQSRSSGPAKQPAGCCACMFWDVYRRNVDDRDLDKNHGRSQKDIDLFASLIGSIGRRIADLACVSISRGYSEWQPLSSALAYITKL